MVVGQEPVERDQCGFGLLAVAGHGRDAAVVVDGLDELRAEFAGDDGPLEDIGLYLVGAVACVSVRAAGSL